MTDWLIAQGSVSHYRIDRRLERENYLEREAFQSVEPTSTFAAPLTTKLAVGLDGAMICLAMATLSIFHPGRLMKYEAGLMKLSSQSVLEMRPKGGFLAED